MTHGTPLTDFPRLISQQLNKQHKMLSLQTPRVVRSISMFLPPALIRATPPACLCISKQPLTCATPHTHSRAPPPPRPNIHLSNSRSRSPTPHVFLFSCKYIRRGEHTDCCILQNYRVGYMGLSPHFYHMINAK